MIRGIRGAITVNENNAEQMLDATKRLMGEIISSNEIKPEQVAQVLISVTDDINAAFPAKVLREIAGWELVPVMCMKEISVPNSLEKCIRVMLTVNTDKAQHEIEHIYLENAVKLRPDLSRSN